MWHFVFFSFSFYMSTPRPWPGVWRWPVCLCERKPRRPLCSLTPAGRSLIIQSYFTVLHSVLLYSLALESYITVLHYRLTILHSPSGTLEKVKFCLTWSWNILHTNTRLQTWYALCQTRGSDKNNFWRPPLARHSSWPTTEKICVLSIAWWRFCSRQSWRSSCWPRCPSCPTPSSARPRSWPGSTEQKENSQQNSSAGKPESF